MDPSDDIPATSAPGPAPSPAPVRRDGLTILRILMLTGGVAVGIMVFVPDKHKELQEVEAWRAVANAVVIGLSLPAPLFVMAAARRSAGLLGPGSLFAMGMGTGSLLLLPPPLIAAYLDGESTAPACLYYLMPQAALWFLLGAVLARQITRGLFDRIRTPWTERYGYFLALLWSPLGVFHLVNFYREALGYPEFE